LENQEGKHTSLLLNQAVFLAASRVSSAPGVAAYASSEQFYQRAKALFWQGHEKNPVTVIAATIMLHVSCQRWEDPHHFLNRVLTYEVVQPGWTRTSIL
jgi:putative effector of murein hydrolase